MLILRKVLKTSIFAKLKRGTRNLIKIDELQEALSHNKQDKNLQIELEKTQKELKELRKAIEQATRK